MVRMDIRDTARLLQSISTSSKEEDLSASVTIEYNYIARFVELGVGKNVPLSKVSQSSRVPRLFIAPVVNDTVQQMADTLVGLFGDKYIFNIFPKLDDA